MEHTLADGIYTYPAPFTGAKIVAYWQNGLLTSLTEHGDTRATITALTAAHVAHELSYAKGVQFVPVAVPVTLPAA